MFHEADIAEAKLAEGFRKSLADIAAKKARSVGMIGALMAKEP